MEEEKKKYIKIEAKVKGKKELITEREMHYEAVDDSEKTGKENRRKKKTLVEKEKKLSGKRGVKRR